MENLVSLKNHNITDHLSQSWTPASTSLNENAFNYALGPPYTRNLRIGLLSLMIVTAFFGNVAVIISICLPGLSQTATNTSIIPQSCCCRLVGMSLHDDFTTYLGMHGSRMGRW
ncbi:neuropeptide S receptor [Caerostris extrusa]|uniref:Neuropeptide S receptor n=1 Tax=Caerostris extrusa TaxID=172846 RepID=A0AAV4WVQ6_CAEEX|nr:neuropeptide S receptor [Caerostris extrusa]